LRRSRFASRSVLVIGALFALGVGAVLRRVRFALLLVLVVVFLDFLFLGLVGWFFGKKNP
jgi:hypothetical protein